jgi:hypothetical protein
MTVSDPPPPPPFAAAAAATDATYATYADGGADADAAETGDKLLKFWDNYYCQHQNQADTGVAVSVATTTAAAAATNTAATATSTTRQEWITTPTNDLFDFMYGTIINNSNRHNKTVLDEDKRCGGGDNNNNNNINSDHHHHQHDDDDDVEGGCDRNGESEAAAATTTAAAVVTTERTSIVGPTVKVLEIGCGTSTMSRDFYLHCIKEEQSRHRPTPLLVRATDGSQVCIDQCLQRDNEFVRRTDATTRTGMTTATTATTSRDNSDRHTTSVSPPKRQYTEEEEEEDEEDDDDEEDREESGSEGEGGGLEYEVLNIAQPPTSDDEYGVWDAIIDKGCLDTFFFRSRNRGGGSGGGGCDERSSTISAAAYKRTYPHDVRTVLDNIWLRLTNVDKSDNDDGGGNGGRTGGGVGIYMLISPRRKIKAIRDYAGFVSVEKHVIKSNTPCVLERKISDAVRTQQSTSYLYVCRKNHNYRAGESDPFLRVAATATATTSNNTANEDNSRDRTNSTDCASAIPTAPSDEEFCPQCGKSFGSIRNGEDVNLSRGGIPYWNRLWNGHQKHCKG